MRKFGVIFIDCWDQDWANSTNFYANINEKLANLPVVSKVFNTSFLSLDIVTQETVNYVKQYIVDHPDKQNGIQDLLDNSGTERLSRQLYNQLDPTCILIPNMRGFVQHVQMMDVHHWIVMGAHWGLCTHTKPLGFDNLLAYKRERPHMNFYAIPECVAKWVHGPDENLATVCTWTTLKQIDLIGPELATWPD